MNERWDDTVVSLQESSRVSGTKGGIKSYKKNDKMDPCVVEREDGSVGRARDVWNKSRDTKKPQKL